MKNTSADYKGCHIVLTPTQQADGTWVCQYSIIEFGQTQLASGKGQSEGPSRLEKQPNSQRCKSLTP
jgi:hypothetical protein